MSTPGTTVGLCGTTALKSSTTACHRSATLGVLHFAELRKNGGCSKEAKERRCNGTVYVMIPPKPFQSEAPLNSTAFLRLQSTEKNRREAPSSRSSEGHQVVLCLYMRYLKCSMHTISPQKVLSSITKTNRRNMLLQSPPFWWIDDNT